MLLYNPTVLGDVTVLGKIKQDQATILSSSAQIASEISGAFDSTSASLALRTTALENFSSSLDATYATDLELGLTSASLASDISNNASNIFLLQTDSSSFAIRVTSLEAFSSSLDLTYATDEELAIVSSSLASRIVNLEAFSSSLDATYATDQQLSEVSGALALAVASISTDFADIQNKPTLLSSSAQIASEISGSFTEASASLALAISSISTDFADIQNKPTLISSSNQIASDISGSFTETSASLALAISSISTDFADIQNKPTLISSSAQIASQISGSSNALSASLSGRVSTNSADISTQTLRIDAILSASSANTDTFAEVVQLINSVDLENDQSFASHYSSSNQRLDVLEAASSSFASQIISNDGDISNLQSASGSFSSRVSNLELFSSSLDTVYATDNQLSNVSASLASDLSSISTDFGDITNNPFVKGTNDITASGDLVPSLHETYDLGSPTLRWRDLYLSGSTIYLGTTRISKNAEGDVEFKDSLNRSKKVNGIDLDQLKVLAEAADRKANEAKDGLGNISIDYNDLTNKPDLFSGDYNDLTNQPDLFDGKFSSLTNKPTLISSSAQLGNINFAVTASHVSGKEVPLVATASFENAFNVTFRHNLDTENVIVRTYTEEAKSDESAVTGEFLPVDIEIVDRNTVHVSLASFDDFQNPTAITSGKIVVVRAAEEDTFTQTFTNIQGASGAHGFNTTDFDVAVYDLNNKKIIPRSIQHHSTYVTVVMSYRTSFRVVAINKKNKVRYPVSNQTSVIVDHQLNSQAVSVVAFEDSVARYEHLPQVDILDNDRVKVSFSAPFTGTVIVTGDVPKKLSQLSMYRQYMVNGTQKEVKHNLGTKYPIVQWWDANGYARPLLSLRVLDENTIFINDSGYNLTGYIVVVG